MSSGDNGLQKKLLQAFNMEAEERLHALGTQLIALEEKVRGGGGDIIEDPASKRLVDDIHRELHSLKGASRAVNFLDIEQVCQDAESVLSAVKRGDIKLTASSFDILHAVVALVEHLARTVGGGRDKDAGARVETLQKALKSLERGKEARLEQPARTGPPEPRREPHAELGSDVPPAGDVPAHEAAAADSEQATQTLQETERRTADGQPLSGTVRLATEDMSAMRAMAEDIQATRASLSRRMRELREVVESVQRIDSLWTEAMYEGGGSALKGGCVGATRIEQNNVSANAFATDTGAVSAGLGDAMNSFLEACSRDFTKVSGQLNVLWNGLEYDRRELDKQVAELSEAMKQALLMPMDALVGHFPRMVRDLARQQGKDAVCEIEGGEIAVDRRILEILNDPFMHVLRNALDHGIESPEERTRAGKPEHGMVRVRIERQGTGLVRIEISDDGRGVDVDELRDKAVGAGILDADRTATLSREELLGLVFLSDLSTAREVSTISGRGLGMAIVRSKVEQAGGHVGIASDKGKGTVLTIVVPVTLTSFAGVVVSAGGRRFVAPMDSMTRLVRADTASIRQSGGRKLFSHGGEVLPLATLAEILSIPERESPETDVRNVLVVRGGDDVAAIVVDEVLEEQEVVLKDLGPQLKRVRHIAGVTTLGTGDLAPVLQMSDVVSAVVRPGVRLARPAASAPAEKKTPRILVVEDSITSRMLIKNVLEAAGYEVLTAVDGMEGFATLGSTPLDLVVSDVEMPRLDGFGLTEKIRADARLADMPVVLVTSLDSREHRERGLNAGANAYIVKSKFDQSNLLDVIHSLL